MVAVDKKESLAFGNAATAKAGQEQPGQKANEQAPVLPVQVKKDAHKGAIGMWP